MIVFLLGAIVLLLLLRRSQESFENPADLPSAEYEALLETPTGRRVKAEMIDMFKAQGVPDAGIPDLVDKGVKQLLNHSWSVYTALTDKSQMDSRIDEITMNEEALRANGRALAEANRDFLKMYFSAAPPTAPGAAVVTSSEITREAGPMPEIQRSQLASLLDSVEDEDLRGMLRQYSTHMISYYTTGEPAYKAAAERSMVAFQKHVQQLDAKAKEESERVAEFIDSYDPENRGMEVLRKELEQVRRTGPMMEDQYETQKRINESMPEPEQTNYVLKAGLIVGVLAIGFVAKGFGDD